MIRRYDALKHNPLKQVTGLLLPKDWPEKPRDESEIMIVERLSRFCAWRQE